MIFHESNGWRDLSDEGPVYYLADKYQRVGNETIEWNVVRYDYHQPYLVTRNGEKVAEYPTQKEARAHVDLEVDGVRHGVRWPPLRKVLPDEERCTSGNVRGFRCGKGRGWNPRKRRERMKTCMAHYFQSYPILHEG